MKSSILICLLALAGCSQSAEPACAMLYAGDPVQVGSFHGIVTSVRRVSGYVRVALPEIGEVEIPCKAVAKRGVE